MSKPTAIVAATLGLLFNTLVPAQDMKTIDPLSWPAISSEQRPWTRWWWLGSAVEQPTLTNLLQQYQQAGIGGVEICPIYGAKGHEEKYLPFLSPQWVRMLAHTTAEAQRLGIGVDLTTGTGWPFGGKDVSFDFASSDVVFRKLNAKGGESISTEIVGDPVQCVIARSDQGEKLDLTDKVQDKKLSWTAAPGNWTIYIAAMKRPIQKVKRAAPGAEGNVLDPYSVKAMEHYVGSFDRAFADVPMVKPRAHFHDSFEYYNATWTTDFFEQFKKRRGYDLRDQLPAMLDEGDSDTIARVKSDYRQTIAELHLDYIRRWTVWAHSQQGISRNQAHGAPGNLLDLYAAADIPETEIFGPLDVKDYARIKFASSAAHVTGRNLASSEAFTWLGEHFQVSLNDLKPAVDFLFLGEINHIFFHGVPYSPENIEWPGWLFYASVHFGPMGGLWRDLPAFNDYASRCQAVLQSGSSDDDLLLYHPIFDVWHNPQGMLIPLGVHSQDKWNFGTPFYDGAENLRRGGYTFDIVSDAILKNVKCENGALVLGGHRYKAVVVPACQRMTAETLAILHDFAANNGKVIFEKAVPAEQPGFLNAGKSNDLTRTQNFVIAPTINEALKQLAIPRETMADVGIQFVRRSFDGGHHYFIVNGSDQPFDGWLPIAVHAESVVLLDPLYADRTGEARVRIAEGQTQAYLQLGPGESRILRAFDAKQENLKPWKDLQPAGVALPIPGTWQVDFIEGGPVLPKSFSTDQLESFTKQSDPDASRFCGTARYRIEFDRPAGAEDWLLQLGKVADSARVSVNGKKVGTVWCAPFALCIGDKLKAGRNTLEIEVTNVAANRIADADRRGVNWKAFHEINFVNIKYEPFDASTWPVREAGLLGPVTLLPLKSAIAAPETHK